VNVFPGKQPTKSSYFSIKYLLLGIIGVCALIYVSICCIFIAKSVFKPSNEKPDASMFDSVFRSLRGVKSLSDDELEAIEEAKVRATLGKGTWNFLHRLAAKFDKDPSEERKATVLTFFKTFSELYPCEECAKHFRQILDENPVDVSSNKHLSIWLCEMHNIVNKRLKKPLFSCTVEALQKEYGSCGCFENTTATIETN
jgi:Erv1 / Alr family